MNYARKEIQQEQTEGTEMKFRKRVIVLLSYLSSLLFTATSENGGMPWTCTTCRKHALFSKQARLARPMDIPNWSAWQDLHLQPFRLERNASALGYTRLVPTAGVAPTLCAV